jgi:outer membrane protein TolC
MNLAFLYTSTDPLRIISTILLAGFALNGCTADSYEREADRQIQSLVKEREKSTIGYQPQVDASAKPPDRVAPAQAYSKIPQTPLQSAVARQVEPLRVELQYGPLGPKRFDWATGDDMPHTGFSYDTLDSRIRDHLRLGPPSLDERPITLDFFGSLKYGVEHSRSYQDTMADLYVSALNVSLQRHLFDPIPSAGASLTYVGGQKDTAYQAALDATTSVGVTQKLPYGGTLAAQGLVTFVNALSNTVDSAENASVVLSASIPLLRGAGMVNLEPLISGERQLVYQVRTFESFRRDYVISIASQYFGLLNLQQSVLARRVNYASFVTLTERSRALYAAGRVAYIELQRALQEQLTAETQLISAQESYTAALDSYKLLLGMPTSQPLDIVAVELDIDLPKVNEAQAVELGLKYRLDLQTARDLVEDARRKVENAKNGLLPDLTFNAQGVIGSRVNNPASQFDERTNTYSAGLNLDLPLDRVAERNVYRTALINVQRAQRDYEGLKDQMVSDVAASLRLIAESKATLEIQRQGIDLAEKRRENAYELLRSGKSTSTRDLVEAQNSLLASMDAFEQARATFQVNVLRFLRNSGTLRVEPSAGSIGHAMDRLPATPASNNLSVVR